MTLLSSLIGIAFQWSWRNSLQVAPLILLVLLVEKAFGKRLTAGSRYALGFLVVVGLLLPVIPSSPLSLANFVPALPGFGNPAPGSLAPPERWSSGRNQGLRSINSGASPGPRWANASQAAGLVWISGVACLAVIAIACHRKWTRLIERGRRITEPRTLDLLERAQVSVGTHRPVSLVGVERLNSPAVFGLRRVYLLLPESALRQLSPQELELVFMHELTHVRRNDLLMSWILMGVQFLHWFNPLVWLALHRLRAERELMCDAAVLRILGPGARVAYGHALLKLLEGVRAESRALSAAIQVAGSPREIKRRIEMIKHHREPGPVVRWVTVALVVGLGCLTLTCARDKQASAAAASPLVVSIDAEGDLRLLPEGKTLTLEEFRKVLASEAKGNTNFSLRITADKLAPWRRIVQVMDAARDAKVGAISAQTAPERSPADRQDAAALSRAADTPSSPKLDSSSRIAAVDIQWVGPRLVNETRVRNNIHTSAGDSYRPAAVDDDVRALYASGFFYNVRVSAMPAQDGLNLSYIVQCNPRVVSIEFQGNSHFSEAELIESVSSRVGRVFNERKLFRDSQAIQSLYEKAGYQGTAVKYGYDIDGKAGAAKVTFQIAQAR